MKFGIGFIGFSLTKVPPGGALGVLVLRLLAGKKLK